MLMSLLLDVQRLHSPTWKLYLFVGILLALILGLLIWPIVWTVEDDEEAPRIHPPRDSEGVPGETVASSGLAEPGNQENATQRADEA